MISANPGAVLTGYDQTPGRPSVCSEGFGRFIIRACMCVVGGGGGGGAAPSMLTHRETAVMATPSRGVKLG